jgi:uncharacterized protein YndB with AHSA1/START domain
MIELFYETKISSEPKKVWQTMLQKETYNQWVKAFSPKSTFIGEWGERSEMLFFDPDFGGTKARIDIFLPHENVLATHIGMVDKEQNEVDGDEMGQKWIGSQEEYILEKQGGETLLKIRNKTDPVFQKMFDDGWPQALQNLKQLCEK